MSNRIFGSFEVLAGNEPPSIVSVDMPDRIARPAAGQPAVQIPIVVQVTDPDGLKNIQKVEMQVNGGSVLFLCDDGGSGSCNGGSSGDQSAGDGAYTVTIQLESTNTPGDYLFQFVVEDRAGWRSERINRTLTVE